jgi:serine/threonine protein phosphatase PrpC
MDTLNVTLDVFGRSEIGKTRKNDEDAFMISDLSCVSQPDSNASSASLAVSERSVLIAVSDGMGGALSGEIASLLVLTSLRQAMISAQAASADIALRESIEVANQSVYKAAQSTNRTGMGATLTAILFHGIYAYVAEIGDSRAYLLRAGRMVQITHDQSYVQQLIDIGAMTQKESESSQLKNVIMQAMGLHPSITVALNRISVRRSDRFLVCSDGLSGNLKDQEILNIMLANTSLEASCEKLIKTAVEQGAEDDVTVVLAEVSGEGAPALSSTERLSIETSKVFAPA